MYLVQASLYITVLYSIIYIVQAPFTTLLYSIVQHMLLTKLFHTVQN